MNNSINNNHITEERLESALANIFTEADVEQLTISARDLYQKLKVNRRFSAWFEANSSGFVENEDYTSVLVSTEVQNNGGIQIKTLQDYDLTIDMAKHICLMSRTDEGKKYRQKLIQLEKDWNSPDQIMARAIRMSNNALIRIHGELKDAQNTIQEQQNLIEEKESQIKDMKPKADKFDTFMESKGSVEYKAAAKALGTTRNKMLAFLRDKKVVNQDNTPRSYPYNKGYLIVKVSSVNNHLVSTTYVTATGIEYLYRLLNKHQTAYTSMYDPNFIPRPYEEFKEIVEELFEENE